MAATCHEVINGGLQTPHAKAASCVSWENVVRGQVMVFSWSNCPFCKKGKAVLDSERVPYKALELDTMADGNAIRYVLSQVLLGNIRCCLAVCHLLVLPG